MSFKQFLEEGRDSPLYHATSYRDILNMLKENKITAYTYHSYDIPLKKKYKKSKYDEVKVVSLTRNIRFAQEWLNQGVMGSGAILELDQRKLTQKYKLLPFNFFSYDGARHGTDELGLKYDGDHGDDFPYNQFEENVVGDIKNLDKYLTKIIVMGTGWKSGNTALATHPLIWDLKTKRFVNAKS